RRLLAEIGDAALGLPGDILPGHLLVIGPALGDGADPPGRRGQPDAEVGVDPPDVPHLPPQRMPEEGKEGLGLRRDDDLRVAVQRLLHHRRPGARTAHDEELFHATLKPTARPLAGRPLLAPGGNLAAGAY